MKVRDLIEIASEAMADGSDGLIIDLPRWKGFERVKWPRNMEAVTAFVVDEFLDRIEASDEYDEIRVCCDDLSGLTRSLRLNARVLNAIASRIEQSSIGSTP